MTFWVYCRTLVKIASSNACDTTSSGASAKTWAAGSNPTDCRITKFVTLPTSDVRITSLAIDGQDNLWVRFSGCVVFIEANLLSAIVLYSLGFCSHKDYHQNISAICAKPRNGSTTECQIFEWFSSTNTHLARYLTACYILLADHGNTQRSSRPSHQLPERLQSLLQCRHQHNSTAGSWANYHSWWPVRGPWRIQLRWA